MFNFLLELLNNGEKEKIKLHISDNFSDYLKNNALFIENNYDYNICYIDISDKEGFIKILPTSKYLNILKKYKEKNNLSDSWFDKMKNDFPTFYRIYENTEIIDKNINNMRIGKWIRKYFKKEPYVVESLVINYKNFQKD
jgi:hypothetical protein